MLGEVNDAKEQADNFETIDKPDDEQVQDNEIEEENQEMEGMDPDEEAEVIRDDGSLERDLDATTVAMSLPDGL